MGDSIKQLRTLVECSVCLEQYKDPRLLECGHTFCKQCLQPLHTFGTINCPNCRRVIAIQSVDVLPVDFKVNVILESLRSAEGETIERCTGCNAHAYHFLCMKCNMKLCEACLENHKLLKDSSVHPVLKQEAITTCRTHNRPCTHICADCQHYVCEGCLLTSCTTHVYTDIATALQRHLGQPSNNLELWSRYFAECSKKENEKFLAIKSEISTQTERIIKLVKYNQNRLVKQLEDFHKESTTRICKEKDNQLSNIKALGKAPPDLLSSGVTASFMGLLCAAEILPEGCDLVPSFSPADSEVVGAVFKEDRRRSAVAFSALSARFQEGQSDSNDNGAREASQKSDVLAPLTSGKPETFLTSSRRPLEDKCGHRGSMKVPHCLDWTTSFENTSAGESAIEDGEIVDPRKPISINVLTDRSGVAIVQALGYINTININKKTEALEHDGIKHVMATALWKKQTSQSDITLIIMGAVEQEKQPWTPEEFVKEIKSLENIVVFLENSAAPARPLTFGRAKDICESIQARFWYYNGAALVSKPAIDIDSRNINASVRKLVGYLEVIMRQNEKKGARASVDGIVTSSVSIPASMAGLMIGKQRANIRLLEEKQSVDIKVMRGRHGDGVSFSIKGRFHDVDRTEQRIKKTIDTYTRKDRANAKARGRNHGGESNPRGGECGSNNDADIGHFQRADVKVSLTPGGLNPRRISSITKDRSPERRQLHRPRRTSIWRRLGSSSPPRHESNEHPRMGWGSEKRERSRSPIDYSDLFE